MRIGRKKANTTSFAGNGSVAIDLDSPNPDSARETGNKVGHEGEPLHLRLGRRGERMACRQLWQQGFRIVARNVRGRRGEIDIVVEKRDRLHFVEVKTRSSLSLGLPQERVDAKKRDILRETAREYLDGFREPPPGGVEFDVLALVLDDRGRVISSELIEEAF